MRVLRKDPGKKAEWVEIENTLEALQEAVGGYIEADTIFEDLVIVCNEEGRINGLPYNCTLFGAQWFGTLLFCGVDGKKFADLDAKGPMLVYLLRGDMIRYEEFVPVSEIFKNMEETK